MNKSIENYDGDIILMKRLIEFFPDYWEWDNSGKIYLNDINNALQKSLPEINDFYGDEFLYPVVKQRTRGWHIGRILYFIKHKAEIKDIEIDNEYSGSTIFAIPIIVDGWHRFAAAYYLYKQEKLDKIHCRYGGRVDLLEYLQGKREVI